MWSSFFASRLNAARGTNKTAGLYLRLVGSGFAYGRDAVTRCKISLLTLRDKL